MANIFDPTQEQIDGWKKWVRERPSVVRKIAQRFAPWTLYRMNSTGQRVTVMSISEDGTLTVAVTGDFNMVMFDRQVFGVEPDDLTECDLPDANEQLGTMLSHEDVEDNIDTMRVMIRPDLWYLDETGKAVRKN